MKFGGTSVGTVGSLRNVKEIVESQQEPVVVVVSALGGITDRLISTARLACEADEAWRKEFDYIVSRHRDIAEGLLPDDSRPEVWKRLTAVLEELHNLFYGIELVGDISAITMDRVVSFGERMSSLLISRIIKNAELYYSPEFILTEKWYGKNIPDSQLTDRLIRDRFANPMPCVAVVPGFISSDRDSGKLTNLGRGGSDYTASIIAASLGADVLEIWTDVDGFMTADPRIISKARVIPRLSFVESMDLCNYGAKVIYPPTIYPVFHKNIPIIIKNTFNPSAPGTFIADEHVPCEWPFRGVSSIKDVCLFTLRGNGIGSLASRVFSVLTKNGVEVLLDTRSGSDAGHSSEVSFATREAEAGNAKELLAKEFDAEISNGEIEAPDPIHNLSTLSIVGENLKNLEGITSTVAGTLSGNGVKVLAIARGNSEINLSMVVEASMLEQSLRLIHSSFLE